MSNDQVVSTEKKIDDPLVTYKKNYQSSLDHAEEFASLFETITTTKDKNDLLNSTQKLFEFKIDSDYVKFPKQFENSDYFLIFMSQLFKLYNLKTPFSLLNRTKEDGSGQLYHSWEVTKQEFRFNSQDGQRADYIEKDSDRKIFSLSLSQKKMSFVTDTINELYLLQKEDSNDLRRQVQIFTEFGKLLEQHYDFNVDFNMFDARNEKDYVIDKNELNSDVLDELFVSASQNNYVFLSDGTANGGYLKLDNQVSFRIAEVKGQWIIKVTDPDEKIALYDVLERYSFIKEWYVNNLDILKLKMVI